MRNRRQVSAGKSASIKTTSMLFAAAIAVTLVGGIGGCEKLDTAGRATDRKVDEALAQSDADRQAGGEQASAKALKDLQQAAGMTGASDAGKARAKSELAREEYRQALALLPEINRNEQGINQAVWDLRQAAAQIGDRSRIASNYQKLEPTPALDKIKENAAAAQAAITKAKGDADKIAADIADRQKKIDGLKAERQKAEADAEQLSDKVASAKGKDALNLIQQASEARIKAGTLAAQMETQTAGLVPLQRQLAIAQQQAQLWETENKASDETKALLDEAWKSNQDQAQKMTAGARTVLDAVVIPKTDKDQPNPGARLAELTKENDRVRGEATKLLQDAAKHAGEAAQASKSFATAINDRVRQIQAKSNDSPELPPLKALLAAYDVKQYQLQQGDAELALANLAADQAQEAARVKTALDELSQSLQTASLQLPSSLPQPKPDELKRAAVADFQAAQKTLEDLANATTNTQDATVFKNAALGSLMLAQYGEFQLTLDDKARQALVTAKQRAKEEQVEVPAAVRDVQ